MTRVVQAPQGHCAVDAEESAASVVAARVPGSCARSLGGPLRRRRYFQGPGDRADGGRANPVTESAARAGFSVSQLWFSVASRSLSAAISALTGWPAGPVWVGPFPGDQAAVPPEHGAQRDQPVPPQPCRQDPDRRGEGRAVGPVEPGPRIGAAQHRDSCRITSCSASLEADERPSRTGQPQTGRRSGTAGEGTRLIIMAHCWPCRIAAAHRMGRLLPPRFGCSI